MPISEEILEEIRDGTRDAVVLDGAATEDVSGRIIAGPLTEKDIDNLVDIMTTSSHFTNFSINNHTMNDADMARLIEAASHNPSLDVLAFKRTEIGKESAKAIANVLRNHTGLAQCNLFNLTISDAASVEFAHALGTNRTLTHFLWMNCTFSDEAKNTLAEALTTSLNKNLLDVNPHSPEMRSLTKQNEQNAIALATAAHEAFTDNRRLDSSTLCKAYMRRQAFTFPRINIGGALDKLNQYVTTLPNIELDQLFTLETLTAPDANGYTPLDNPLVWEKFEAIAAKLAEAGTPITKEFLMQPNADGEPFMMAGILCEKTEAIIRAINANGEHLTPNDLFKDKEPNALLTAMIEEDTVAPLFAVENWLGQKQRPNALYRALPEEGQSQVHNMHTLSSKLEKARTTAPHIPQ